MSFADIYREQQNLFQANYAETGCTDTFKLDYSKYMELAEQGYYRCIGIKHNGILIGYAGLIADKMIHSESILYARVDAIYIMPEHREYRLFRVFLNYIEVTLKSYNITYLFVSSTTKRPLAKLFNRLKYKEQETIFMKEL